MPEIHRLPRRSAYTRKLPKGCVLCEKGAKLVLLVTGRCGQRCSYCPLSSEKRGKDVFFANERRVSEIEEVLDEARLMDALGTGITGGDPLVVLERTIESINCLKKRFGEGHHIHLYTSTTRPDRIRRVARAGLDEIRFHPPLDMWTTLKASEYRDALRLSKRLGMATGMEIPVIPGRGGDLVEAVAFADRMELDFVNLNELEFSETNWRSLRALGLDVREDDDISSGVEGSEPLAKHILKLETDIPLHYCSAAFKDGVQLRRRIMRRAKNVRKPHEVLTRDGTLIKGVIETDLVAATAAYIMNKFGVPGSLLWGDSRKRRLEIAPWVLEEIAAELDMPSYIVEEYPTADRLEVEREPLTRR